MSSAGPLKTFRSITLRMSLPGVLALLLLIFIRAFESFEVPAGRACGQRHGADDRISTKVQSTGVPNFGEVGAYSICLLLIVMLLLFWHHRLSHPPSSIRPSRVRGTGRASSILAARAISPWLCFCSFSFW